MDNSSEQVIDLTARSWEITTDLDIGNDALILRASNDDIYTTSSGIVTAASITLENQRIDRNTSIGTNAGTTVTVTTTDLTLITGGDIFLANTSEVIDLNLTLDPDTENVNDYTIGTSGDQRLVVIDNDNDGIEFSLEDLTPLTVTNVNVTIQNTGNQADGDIIILAAGLNAGSGTVNLIATDDILQESGAVIVAGTLTGTAGNIVNINNNNTFDNLGAFSSSGGFTLNDSSGGLNVIGAISDATGAVQITALGTDGDIISDGVGSINSALSTIELNADRHITLGGTLTAGSTAAINIAQAELGTFSTTATITSTGTTITSSITGSTFDFSGAPAITATIIGTAGSDTLIGRNIDNTWTLDGTPSVGGLTFGNISTLQGSSNIDTFNVTSGSNFDLQGGAGIDVFDIAATLTGSIDGEVAGGTLSGTRITDVMLTTQGGTTGFNGSTIDVTAGFSNINSITGSGVGTLTGRDVSSSWDLDGSPTYNDGALTLDITGFGTLQGGSDIDTYNVTLASSFDLLGGAGVDVFDIDAILTGSIDGEVAGATLQGAQIADVSLSGSGGTTGVNGSNVGVSNDFSNITTLTGTGGGTLTGSDNASSWDLDGTPTYTDAAGITAFSNFATLQGGSDIDSFNVTLASNFDLQGGAGVDVFDLGAVLTGSIDGEVAGATLQGTQITDVSLSGPGGTAGVNGSNAGVSNDFSNITNLTGTGGGTLTGSVNASSWDLGGTPTYTDATGITAFSNFATLQGGSDIDSFNVTLASNFDLLGGAGVDVFDIAATLTGSIDGEVAGATLQGTQITDVTLTTAGGTTGFNGSTIDVTAGFSNINSITGSGVGTLTGRDVSSSWDLDGSPTYNDGALTLDITGFGTLQGGSDIDTYNVTLASSFDLLGGAGVDVFDIDAILTGSINGDAAGAILQGLQIVDISITGASAITGVSGSNLSVTNNFSNINIITGNGAGILTGADAISFWSSTAANSGDYVIGSNTVSFVNFTNWIGGSLSDTFNLSHDVDSVNGGNGANSYNLITSLTSNLTGGIDADEFVFDDAVEIVGSIDGMAGSDTLNLGSYTTALTFILSAGTTDGATGTTAGLLNPVSVDFDNIDFITGGSAGNTFTANSSLTANLTGGTGADTLEVSNAMSFITVTHTFINATDGSINLDGAITSYSDLESVTDNLSATNRVFVFEGGNETIELTDIGGIDDNSFISSTQGQSITFANPVELLTLNTGSGDDTIQLNTLDGNWDADITINGDAATDTVDVISPVTAGNTRTISISVESINGSNGASADLIANIIDLNAGDGIGSSSTLGINSVEVSAVSTDGNINIHSFATSNVEVSNLSTGTGSILFSQSGDQRLSLTSVDTINGSVTVTNAGGLSADIVVGEITTDTIDDVVDLSSTGSIDDLSIDQVTDITAFDIDLNAESGIGVSEILELSATQLDADTANGNIRLDNSATNTEVGTMKTASGNILFTNSGVLTLSDVVTTDGAITVTNTDLLTASNVATGYSNTISLTANGLMLSVIETVGGVVNLDAGSGAISDGNADLNNITANALTADASSGIDLDTEIDSANLQLSASGNIKLDNTGVIDLLDVDTVDGDISINSTGQLTATDVKTANDNDISLTGAGIILDIVDTGTGTVVLDSSGASIADGLTVMVAGEVIINNSNGVGNSADVLNLAAETISFDSGNTGAIFISNNSAAGLAVSGSSQAEIQLTEISGNTVTIPDGSSLISVDNNITLITDGLSVGTASTGLINTGTGDLTIRPNSNTYLINLGSDEINSLSITESFLNQISTSGSFTIGSTTHTAGITIGGAFEAPASINQLSLITAGSISDNGTQLITAATLSLVSGSGIGTLGDAIDVVSNEVTLQVTDIGNVNLSNTGDINLIDMATLDGFITINSTGQLIATDVQTGSDNDINLSAASLVIDHLDAGMGSVILNAGTGGISQLNNVSAVEVIANQLTADAVTGFDLDTQIALANISNSGTGFILLDNTGDLQLTDVDTVDGSLTISSTGQLIVTDVQSGNDSAINLMGTDIVIDVLNAGTGTLTLDANDGLISNDATAVVAGIVNFQNSSGIGSDTNDFSTQSSEINFIAGITGAAFVTNSSASGVSISGDSAGSIELHEATGSLIIAAENLLSNDNSIELFSDLGNIILTGNVDAGSSDLVLQAAGLISGSGLLTSSTLNINTTTGIGSSGNLIQSSSNEIHFFNSTSGGTYISNSSVAGVTISSDVNNAGVINFSETAGELIVNAVSTDGERGVFNSAQNITLSGEISAIGNNITISSDAAINGSSTLIADDIDLTAQSGIGNISGLVTTASDVIFSNASNLVDITSNVSDLYISGNAGSGNINLTNNNGHITLANIITTGDILLDSSNGAIIDGNADAVNLTANDVVILSGSGIGSSDEIETSVDGLTFTNTSTSRVQIVNSITSSMDVQGSNNGAEVNIQQSTADGVINIAGNLSSLGGNIILNSDSMTQTSGLVDAGTGSVSLSSFDSAKAIEVGGSNPTFSDSLLNNIATSNGLTIGSETQTGGVSLIGIVDTSLNVTGGQLSLISNGDVSIDGSMTNAVETSLISDAGNVSINGDLISIDDIILQTTIGNINFGNGINLTSSSGKIVLNSAGSIVGSGAANFTASSGLLLSTEMMLGGNSTIQSEVLNLQQNITTTSGNLLITSANPITINSAIVLSAGDELSLSALAANGELTLNGGDGVVLSGETNINNSGNLTINAGDGSFELLANLIATGDVDVVASDFEIDTTASVSTITGILSLTDQLTSDGIGLATFQPGKLNFDVNEYNTILAAGIELNSTHEVTLIGDFSSVASLVPLTINAESMLMTGSTRIALGSDLNFSTTAVSVTGGLEIDIDGEFMMDGALTATSTVDITAGAGITMGEPSSIKTTDDKITLLAETGDIRLGLLNSGAGNTVLTATTGNIFNNNGVFEDVTQSLTNVIAANVSLSVLDRIGISSTDAVTLDIASNGKITLRFSADTAYINNLRNSRIINNGAGEVIVGLIFSNQILGIGHNLGLTATEEVFAITGLGTLQKDDAENISILGMDFLALLNNDDEDIISSIIPSVPVLIRTIDGWRFEPPSKQQRIDRVKEQQGNGTKYINWF